MFKGITQSYVKTKPQTFLNIINSQFIVCEKIYHG